MPIQTAFDPGLAFDGPTMLARWQQATAMLTHRYLDLYATTMGTLADAHVEAVRAAKLPALLPLTESHVAIWRESVDAYVSAMRGLMDP